MDQVKQEDQEPGIIICFSGLFLQWCFTPVATLPEDLIGFHTALAGLISLNSMSSI